MSPAPSNLPRNNIKSSNKIGTIIPITESTIPNIPLKIKLNKIPMAAKVITTLFLILLALGHSLMQ